MVNLSDYERRGDLNAPFELTKKHEQVQKEALRRREAARCDVRRLSWEAYARGEPCPGCGLPYRDDESWEFKGTINLTEEERARYDAEEARFNGAHGDCHASRHSVSGSLTMHCSRCCPVPPLSPGRIEEIGRILGAPKPSDELMRWRLRLYCGHIAEKQSHFTHRTLHSAFMGSMKCPECGLDPATIVDGEAVALAGEAPRPRGAVHAARTRRPIGVPKPSRAELDARVRELEAEIERLRSP